MIVPHAYGSTRSHLGLAHWDAQNGGGTMITPQTQKPTIKLPALGIDTGFHG
jgi:hypothetical protein